MPRAQVGEKRPRPSGLKSSFVLYERTPLRAHRTSCRGAARRELAGNHLGPGAYRGFIIELPGVALGAGVSAWKSHFKGRRLQHLTPFVRCTPSRRRLSRRCSARRPRSSSRAPGSSPASRSGARRLFGREGDESRFAGFQWCARRAGDRNRAVAISNSVTPTEKMSDAGCGRGRALGIRACRWGAGRALPRVASHAFLKLLMRTSPVRQLMSNITFARAAGTARDLEPT